LTPNASNAVFLSYASEDTTAAQRLAEALRAAGVEVWFDREELRGGDAWDRRIREQIRDCRLFIPMISAHTEVRSEGYFRREWRLAVERAGDMAEDQPFLMPVVIDDTNERSARVPDSIRQAQWSHLPDGESSSRFVERVKLLLKPAVPRVRAGMPSPANSRQVQPASGAVSSARGRLVLGGIAALAVLAGYLGIDRVWLSKRAATVSTDALSSRTETEKSIAVLPFVDLSETHDQEYFAAGLAEEVLSLLSQLPGLKVVSETSSFQLKGHLSDARSVGVRLGTSYIVEGSVRRYEDRVRVTAKLISTSDGSQPWSQSYERDVGDVLRMQQEIAASLGRALQVEVGDLTTARTESQLNKEAYTSYLRGLHAMDRYDESGIQEAISYFEQALVSDPTLTRARESLAEAHYLQFAEGFVAPSAGAERLRQDVNMLLAGNEQSALAHALKAELLITYDWDWTRAEEEARRAVSLGPKNRFALYAAGDIAVVLGQYNDANQFFHRSLAIDPLNADTLDLLSWALYGEGRFAEAEEVMRKLLAIDDSYSPGHYSMGLYLLAEGHPKDALVEMRREKDSGFQAVGLAMAYFMNGQRAESDSALSRAEQESSKKVAYAIACTHAVRGETDAAFVWLDRAYQQKDIWLEYIKGEWPLTGLRNDSRYRAFLSRMKLPE
jgi:adenylate cyclase